MKKRTIMHHILRAVKEYPVVSLTGTRQSGKTTLLKSLFPDYDYALLEEPDTRQFALQDPRGFLSQFKKKVIIDEAQRAPELFSYIQGIVDEAQIPGQFVMSGSQNFLLMRQISQSLAGRVAIFHLLPFSMSELYERDGIHPVELNWDSIKNNSATSDPPPFFMTLEKPISRARS